MTTISLSIDKIKNFQSVKYYKSINSIKNKIFNRIQNKIDFINIFSLNWKIVCFLCVFINLFLLFFYVWQVNNLTKGIYTINNYEKEINKITNENRNLEISLAEKSFLGETITKIQELNFQKNTTIKYIQIPEKSVAIVKTK